MTINVFDLVQNQSLLVELGEKDINKVCGGAGAVDAATQSVNESAAEQINFTKAQQEISAAQAAASIDMAVARNAAEVAQGIK